MFDENTTTLPEEKKFNNINMLVNSLQFSQVTYHLLKINSFYSELKQNDVTLSIMRILHTVNDEEKTKILTSLCTCSDEGLTLSFENLNGDQFTLSTQLMIPDYLVILSH